MKILLVDDEEHVLRGLSRMIECEIDQWELETALSGAEALDLLDSEPFNVVVSGMRMPGMNGAEFLTLVEERHPNVFRVVLSGQADRETVLSAVQPMHQYLSKPCDIHVLINIIKRAEIFQNTISSAAVLDAIGKANCLPSLPNIVREISDEFSGDDWTAHSVASIIEKDPLLSARILQIANSAIFAIPNPILDVEKGVSIVGAEMIQSLAMSQAFAKKDAESSALLSSSGLFDHSFEVAFLARQFSHEFHPTDEDAGSVFSGALLHDVGKLILLDAFPKRYPQLLRVSESEKRELWKLELEELGATHQGVGAYLLELWGVPNALVEIVASHHSFDVCSRRTVACQLVYGANWLCNGGDEAFLKREVAAAKNAELAAMFEEELLAWKNSTLQTSAKD